MTNQKLKGLVRGWKNEINRLKDNKTKLNTPDIEKDIIIETLKRCINDVEILILIEHDF